MNNAQEIIDSCDEEQFDLNQISEGIRLYKQDNVIDPNIIRMNSKTLKKIEDKFGRVISIFGLWIKIDDSMKDNECLVYRKPVLPIITYIGSEDKAPSVSEIKEIEKEIEKKTYEIHTSVNLDLSAWDEHIRQEMILNFREQF